MKPEVVYIEKPGILELSQADKEWPSWSYNDWQIDRNIAEVSVASNTKQQLIPSIMKDEIIINIDHPQRLEVAYRANKTRFKERI